MLREKSLDNPLFMKILERVLIISDQTISVWKQSDGSIVSWLCPISLRLFSKIIDITGVLIMRSLVPTAVACLFLAQSICTKAEAANIVNLTQGQWEVTGSDSVNWNGSDLVFETQSPNGADFNITGYFDWYSREVYRGRELFAGTYTSNGFLNLRGFQLINPIGIGLANYQAEVLSPSQISNGTWGGLNIFSGIWSAANESTVAESDPNTAAVPEPSSMLGLGIVTLAGTLLKRRTKCKTRQ